MNRLVRNWLYESAIEATMGFDELLEASDVRASEATGSIFPGYFDWVCERVGYRRRDDVHVMAFPRHEIPFWTIFPKHDALVHDRNRKKYHGPLVVLRIHRRA